MKGEKRREGKGRGKRKENEEKGRVVRFWRVVSDFAAEVGGFFGSCIVCYGPREGTQNFYKFVF